MVLEAGDFRHTERMRSVFFILALAVGVLLPAAPASAQQASSAPPVTRGQLQGDAVVPAPPTQEQIREANGVYQNCESGVSERSYFDCQCVALTFLQHRVQDKKLGGRSLTAPDIEDIARKSCPNTVGIAGMTYTRCLSWAPRMRPDYEAFCECYANEYANTFSRSPTTSIRRAEALSTVSMNQCNGGQPAIDRMTRNKRIEQLKKRGLYETLFPSAKTLNKSTMPPPPASTSATRPLQQILTDKLYETENE
jgi:hypothetical protein